MFHLQNNGFHEPACFVVVEIWFVCYCRRRGTVCFECQLDEYLKVVGNYFFFQKRAMESFCLKK